MEQVSYDTVHAEYLQSVWLACLSGSSSGSDEVAQLIIILTKGFAIVLFVYASRQQSTVWSCHCHEGRCHKQQDAHQAFGDISTAALEGE